MERRLDRFNGGTLAQVLVTPSGTDPSLASVSLMPRADAFSAASFAADRWRLAYVAGDPLGIEVRQQYAGLQMTYPRGYTNLTNAYYTASPSVVFDPYGITTSLVWVGAEHRTPFSGPFDVQVDFSNFQGSPATSGSSPLAEYGLMVSDQSLEATKAGAQNMVFVRVQSGGTYRTSITVGGTPQADSHTTVTPAPAAGKLRIARDSSNNVAASYWDGSTWQTLGTYSSFSSSDMYVSLVQDITNGVGACTFQNFTVNTPSAAYPASGIYTSAVYDAGRSVTWNSIQWDATVPSGTTLKFQIAVASSASGPWTSYVGPDNTSGTWFTTSGTAIYSGTTGRYCRYQATLTGGSATPTVNRVDLLYGGTNASSERYYSFDAAGNMTGKVVETSGASTVTETRTFNNLNQITQNVVVVTGGSTTTWTFTWDASGNMATRSDGSNIWTHTWDEDNRLLQVAYVGSPSNWTVSFTYDLAGRMLTRTDSFGTIKFVWASMKCVSEFDPSGNETRSYIPDGWLRSFEQSGTVYQVHCDALGSVRAVTDNTGAVADHYECDAWGNALSSSSTGGIPYRFLGGLGVRWDGGTGLYYMRRRWYDSVLAAFISRDDLRLPNRYKYAANQPTRLTDRSGAGAEGIPWWDIERWVTEAEKALKDNPVAGATLRVLVAPLQGIQDIGRTSGAFSTDSVGFATTTNPSQILSASTFIMGAATGGLGDSLGGEESLLDTSAAEVGGGLSLADCPSGAQYQILNGVRRSVATYKLQRGTIDAEIFTPGGGKLTGTGQVPLTDLWSPKSSIQGTDPRFIRVYTGLERGDQLPPIEIYPTSNPSGTNIPNVTIQDWEIFPGF